MKSFAIWLYLVAFLVSFVLGGPLGLVLCFPVLALIVTVLLGVISVGVRIIKWVMI